MGEPRGPELAAKQAEYLRQVRLAREDVLGWIPQPRSNVWTFRIAPNEVEDEEYRLFSIDSEDEFAVSAGPMWPTDWPVTGRPDLQAVERSPTPPQSATHHGAGRYDLVGTVVAISEGDGYPLPNIWQSHRNCVIDCGLLMYAHINVSATLRVGATVTGRADLTVDFAAKGTPVPMIYDWRILRLKCTDAVLTAGSRDLPNVVFARRLSTDPKSERETEVHADRRR